MVKKNRTAAMVESTIKLRNLIIENHDLSQEELMQALKIGSEASLYSLLSGLGDDPELCIKGEFLLCKEGKRLTMAEIEEFLSNNPTREKYIPKPAERLLYLYWCLHKAIPDGGLTFDVIKNIYKELFMESGGRVPKAASLRRMIYRDMEEFEKLRIWIDRSESTKKYCLRDEYLPKLTPESAATVYVSMLLYRDTLF